MSVHDTSTKVPGRDWVSMRQSRMGRGEHQGENTGLLLSGPALKDLGHHSELDRERQGECSKGYMRSLGRSRARPQGVSRHFRKRGKGLGKPERSGIPNGATLLSGGAGLFRA